MTLGPKEDRIRFMYVPIVENEIFSQWTQAQYVVLTEIF